MLVFPNFRKNLTAVVQTKFADWIKNRIADYDFVENQDFVCVSENSETQMAVMLPENSTTPRLIWQPIRLRKCWLCGVRHNDER